MKTWMLIFSLIAVLGFTGLADAKGAKKHAKPLKGTIAAINGTSFTMTTKPSKKNPTATPQTYTVDSSTATVTGTLAVGAKVSVVGSLSADKITATTVTVSTKHKKK